MLRHTLYHSNVICPVTNGQRHGLLVLLDQINNPFLIKARTGGRREKEKGIREREWEGREEREGERKVRNSEAT